MNLQFEKYFVWLGLLLGLVPLFGLSRTNSINLEVLSIFFGALLATLAILQTAWDSKTIGRLKLSGHIKYLIAYILLPIYLCFMLILVQLLHDLIAIPALLLNYAGLIALSYNALIFALLGVLLLSVFRILLFIAPIIKKEND